MEAYGTSVASRRRIVPAARKDDDVKVDYYVTSYQRGFMEAPNLATDAPKRGHARMSGSASDVGGVLKQSGTTAADAIPTSRASFKNPKTCGNQPERLSKIQQPKEKPFAPGTLERTVTRFR